MTGQPCKHNWVKENDLRGKNFGGWWMCTKCDVYTRDPVDYESVIIEKAKYTPRKVGADDR
jgi:hypothetical protein